MVEVVGNLILACRKEVGIDDEGSASRVERDGDEHLGREAR
jgi:hypothetical protein